MGNPEKVNKALIQSLDGLTVCKQLLDMVRCSIIARNGEEQLEDIKTLLRCTLEKDGVEVIRCKNMFKTKWERCVDELDFDRKFNNY